MERTRKIIFKGTDQDIRLSRLDKRMDDLSAIIDKNSAKLDEHSKTISAMEDAIRRGAFDEVQALADAEDEELDYEISRF